jgi:SAM-dependent methyltransferase
VRKLVDAVTRSVAWLRRRRYYSPKEPVRLNLGSGLTVADGWVNIDSSLNALGARLRGPLLWLPYKLSSAQRWYSYSAYVGVLRNHVFIHHDLSYGIPLPDGTCECVYASHFFEHIDRGDAEHLFKEARRVLLPGGSLRVVVPDFAKLVASYQQGEGEEIIDALFAKPNSEGWYNRHRYFYDFALLERLLREAGFTGIVACEDGVGSVPDLDAFEGVRPSRYLLFVEASKPLQQDL